MSAVLVFLPTVSVPCSPEDQSRGSAPSASIQKQAHARQGTAPASWQLTDRGIAMVLLVAGIIMTVALTMIGLTVVRVTSADDDPSPQSLRQADH
jgi:hypothetical protein